MIHAEKSEQPLGRGRDELRQRTKNYALQTIAFVRLLPNATEAAILGERLLNSGTFVGVKYREACRAKSDDEFILKLEQSLQELDESGYWLELIEQSGMIQTPDTQILHAELMQETIELTAIFMTIVRKIKQRYD